MHRAFSNPKSVSGAFGQPDLYVWKDEIVEVDCERCGAHDVNGLSVVDAPSCPSCERPVSWEQLRPTGKAAWWFWYCLPGCMPDSTPFGPYDTEAEAEQAVRDENWDDTEDEDTEEE